MNAVKVISLFEKETDPNGIYINTTSRAETLWETDLSPFYLGPCELYGGYRAVRMENAWQYSKVYPEFTDKDGNPTELYYEWANEGWSKSNAVRYPMGKGKKPLYSVWADPTKKYPYVEARKKIYIPLYVRAVIKTKGFQNLKDLHQDICAFNCNQTRTPEKKGTIYLKDYDAYRHEEKGLTLTDVVNNPNKKCGHAFVLMMLLTDDPILKECQLPL